MPSEERRAYMRQYMRERRANERAAAAAAFEEGTEPGQETTSKGSSLLTWALIGFVALIVIAVCVQGWRNGTPGEGTTSTIPHGYQF